MLFYGKTDVGNVRETNQDSYNIGKFSENIGYAVVCDGMGGQSCGDLASRLAVEAVSEELNKGFINMVINKENVQKFIVEAVKYSNMVVFEKALEHIEYQGMGTTLILAVVIEDQFYLAHIGDSRIYSFKNNELKRLTVDHSLVQELFEQGKITESEIENHPNKNIITRVVGVSMSVSMDYIHGKIYEDEYLLLCTDGLTNMCNDKLIQEILQNSSPEEAVDLLINKANELGGKDNITVLIIKR